MCIGSGGKVESTSVIGSPVSRNPWYTIAVSSPCESLTRMKYHEYSVQLNHLYIFNSSRTSAPCQTSTANHQKRYRSPSSNNVSLRSNRHPTKTNQHHPLQPWENTYSFSKRTFLPSVSYATGINLPPSLTQPPTSHSTAPSNS